MFKKSTLICLVLTVGIFSSCTFFKRLGNSNFTRLTIEIETNSDDNEKIVKQAKFVISRRLDAFGVDHEFIEQDKNVQNSKQFSIRIYDPENFQKVKKYVLEQGKLEILEVVSPPNPNPVKTYPTEENALESLGNSPPTDQKVLKYIEKDSLAVSMSEQWIVVKTPAIVDGMDVRNASAVPPVRGLTDYQISFSLKPEGAKKFGEWTGKNINKYLAVSLNDEVKSTAFIRTQIFDQGQIDGRFTKEEAENLALVLRSGTLPVKVKIIKEESNANSKDSK